MAPAEDLRELLRQVEGARSPLERLRRIALAWRELRRLNRAERARLATALGLEGAETLLERLSVRRGGLAPAELLRAVHAAQQADPSDLEALMRDLADPTTRREMVIQGLAQMEERLASEAEELPDAEASPADEEAEEKRQAAAPDAPPLPEPEAPPPPGSAPAAAKPEPPPPLRHPAEPSAKPDRPAPAAATPPPRPVAPATEMAAVAPPRTAAPGPEMEPPRPPAVAGTSGEDLAVALAAEPRLVARLRLLSAALGEGVRPEPAEAARVLAAFPEGWAQRRALAALLEHGVPAQVADALGLVATLPAAHDRAWCLAALARHRPVAIGELEGALDALGSPLLRRRVERLASV